MHKLSPNDSMRARTGAFPSDACIICVFYSCMRTSTGVRALDTNQSFSDTTLHVVVYASAYTYIAIWYTSTELRMTTELTYIYMYIYRISSNRNRPSNSNRPSFKNRTNHIPLQIVTAPRLRTAQRQTFSRKRSGFVLCD